MYPKLDQVNAIKYNAQHPNENPGLLYVSAVPPFRYTNQDQMTIYTTAVYRGIQQNITEDIEVDGIIFS